MLQVAVALKYSERDQQAGVLVPAIRVTRCAACISLTPLSRSSRTSARARRSGTAPCTTTIPYSARLRELLVEMSERLRLLEDRLKRYDQRIAEFARADERAGRLMAVEGVGPLTATALIAAVGNARQFRSGRELSAWLGLVPRQHSSGGRSVLLGISKRGDRYLRTLLVHGARAALRFVARKLLDLSNPTLRRQHRSGFSRLSGWKANSWSS